MESEIEISVVATVYQDARAVPELVKRLHASLSELTDAYEIILVEDGGADNSWSEIHTQCGLDTRVKGLQLSRNFGQQIAVSAGMRYSSGKVTVVMDGDLQNPPESIGLLYEEIVSGKDVVYTSSPVRNNFREECSSKLFWFLINRVLDVQMVPNQLMMKAFSRKFLETYNSYNERVRVVAGITQDIGMDHAVIQVPNQRRTHGKGSYSFLKRFHLMLDIILTLSNKPLEFLINLSLLAILMSSFLGIWCVAMYFIHPDVPPGYTSIIAVISFFGSSTLLVLGVIGRYLSSIYTEVRQRPLFLLQNRINLENE